MSSARTRGVAAALVVAATAAVLTGGSTPATAGAGRPAGTNVTVTGSGSVTERPDVLRVSFGLAHTASDVSTALRRANEAVRRVRDVLRADGVADGDVRTTGLQMYGRGSSPRKFHARQSMSVVLRDLDRAGRTIGAVAEAGGDALRVDGVEFTLSDRTASIGRARDEAFAEAKAKAQRYAAMTGRSLGRVHSVSEGVSYATVSRSSASAAKVASAGAAAAAAPAADVPISPGRERTAVRTTVVWTLK